MKKLANPKILMIVDAWFPLVGGGQIHVWELSKQLAINNNKVTILTRNLGEWNEEFENVKIVRVGFSRNFGNIFDRIYFLIVATFYCLTHQFDIIHAHAFSPGLIIPIIKLFKSTPTIFTVHGQGFKVVGLPFLGKFLEKIVFYKIPYDLEITVAKSTLTKKSAAKKVVVIPNGVDIERFLMAQRNRSDIKNILFVGRLSYEKGVDLLIEAVSKIDNQRLGLTIIGQGQEEAFLKGLARNRRINFIGKKTGQEVINEMKKADLVVLPSRSEGQPVILLEAWAARVPILVTNVGDNPFYIKNGVNGFICQPTVNDLTISLKKIIINKNITKITDKGFLEVQKYSWQKIGEMTLAQYNKLLK